MAIARRGNTPCVHGPGCPHSIGPAAAHAEGLNAIAHLSVLDGVRTEIAQDVGAGPVERRPATAADIARLSPPDVPPPKPGMPMGTHPAYRLATAAERAALPATTPPEEIAVPAIPDPPAMTDLRLRYVAALIDMLAAGNNAAESGLMDRIERLLNVTTPASEAGPIIPRTIPEPVAVPKPANHTKAADTAKAERAKLVMAALARNGGDHRAAAAELGMRLNAVTMVARYANSRQAATA